MTERVYKNETVPVYSYNTDEVFKGDLPAYTPLVAELFTEPAFIALKPACAKFLLMLYAHKATKQQRDTLYSVLIEYNELLGLGMSETDIHTEAYPNKRIKYTHGYFVIPESHLKQYGISAQYANKYKNQLIDAGFIEVCYGKKGKRQGWLRNTTVYRFSDKWKQNTVNH